jgi:hypothetical protein
MRKILDIEFNKLQHAQHRMSPDQVLNPNVFAQEVLQILEKEIPRLQMNNPPDSPPTSHSGPSTTSSVLDQPSPITPPSTSSHHSGGNKAFVVEPQSEEIQISRRKVLRRRRRTKSEPPVSAIFMAIPRMLIFIPSKIFRPYRRLLRFFQV